VRLVHPRWKNRSNTGPALIASINRVVACRMLAAVAPISGIALQPALEQLTNAGLIFCRGEPPNATSATAATKTIPIAFISSVDPVKVGIRGPGRVGSQPLILLFRP
jgi:hypothetical protein